MPFLGGRGQASRGYFGGGTTPDAPTGLSSTPGDQQLFIAFTAPAFNGGLEITNYQYALSTNGGSSYGAWTALSPADATSPVTIPSLVNGTAYYVKLRAVNALGAGAESSPVSSNTTPFGNPVATTGSGSDTTTTPSAPTTNSPTNLQSFSTFTTVQLTSGSSQIWTNPYPSGAATGTGTLNGSSGTTSFVWGTSSGSYPNEVVATSNAYAGTTWSRGTTIYYRAKITNTSCTLQFTGTVNANGNNTTVSFEYGTSSGVYPSSVSAGTVSGASNTAVSANLSSLGAGTYYFRVKAVNARGTIYGSQQQVTISAKSSVASSEQSFTPPHVGTIYNVVVVGGGGGGQISGGGGGGVSASSDRPVGASLTYSVGGAGVNNYPNISDGGSSSLTNGSWTMTGSGGLKANIYYPESGGSCGSGSGGTVYNSSTLSGGAAGYGCEDYAGGGGAGINGAGGHAYYVDIPYVSYILYAGGGGAAGGLFGEVTVSSGGGGKDTYWSDGDQSAGTPACDFGGGGSTSTAAGAARDPQGGVVRFRYYGP